MSMKGTHTTSSYIEWDEAVNLIHRLFRDGNYTMSMFIGLGIFTGLRVSDLKQITWGMVLQNKEFTLEEIKTGKIREVRINPDFQKHAQKCYEALGINDMDAICLTSQVGTIYSTQRLNVILKDIKDKYNIKCSSLSCHSLRKTFGRKVFLNAGESADIALVKLSSLFNHANLQITKRYLGISRDEMLQTYELLEF